jgi:RNA polymerase sigma factor (sigma-70 family)
VDTDPCCAWALAGKAADRVTMGRGGQEQRPGDVVPLPAAPAPPVEVALEELEFVYAYIFARVGNRADAEDLTQQVALKAIPRLRSGASPAAIRSYLFATARSALATFWTARFGLPEEELREDLWVENEQPEATGESVERVERILSQLPANYRKLLELRFLRGYSLKEVAAELGTTLGGIKVMQLRALRAAARVATDA